MCGTPVGSGGPSREARKTVTSLFIDIVGSTELAERLDPEPLRELLDRYFAACVSAVGEYGGEVEKFIGDAVMAVFGASVTREDDAVRAVRAAAGALGALGALNADVTASHGVRLEARCGLCTGEVMVITAPDGGFRVVGDAVNTASRLQGAARPGEILIGERTAAVVRGHVGVEPVPRMRLKGKAAAVPAWRVTDPAAGERDGPGTPGAPLVGRDDELHELGHGLRRVRDRGQVCLVTVLGAPGIGKTRLVGEFLATLADGAAVVLRGRCSAYGRGVTYAPLAGMLHENWAGLAGPVSSGSEAGARAVRTLEAVMAAGEPAGVEEISWAVRYLLEELGGERPVIMVWDDLHRAEETLLDLIDDIATWLLDVPVLLLCVARTELLEIRPAWGGGKPCASTLELGPLTREESARLVGELAAHAEVQSHEHRDARERIAVECEGNPLFAELMLDLFADTAPGPVGTAPVSIGTAPGARIPPTVHALLSARLDQLPDDERRLVEMAAVAGRDFSHDTLRAMAGDEGADVAAPEVVNRLLRRRIVQRVDRENLRFRQSLLRDTAYAQTPKAHRRRRHLFLARGLGRDGEGRLAFACHVEAACHLQRDLLPGDTRLPDLAPHAAGVLIEEGERALRRKDLPAAAALLERGRALLGAGDPRRLAVALHICDAWLGMQDAERCLAVLAAEESAGGDGRRTRITCAIQRCVVALRLGLAPPEAVRADADRLAAELREEADDDLIWCRYHQLRAYLHLTGESAGADASLRHALARARAMRDRYEEDRLLCAICEVAKWTPGRLGEGLELCAALSARFAANRALLVPVLVTRAYLTALAGRIGDARRTLGAAREHAGDLHLDLADAAVLEMSGVVESLAGAHDRAEELFRRAAAALRAAPRAPDADTAEAAAARELFHRGRTGEAAAALDRLVRRAAGPGLRTRIAVASLRGRIASAYGRHDEAVAMVAEARELSGPVDDPCLAGDVLFDAAVVLRAAGRSGESADAARRAAGRYAAKGATLLVSRVERWVDGGA
ncbi:adenylate/guanylate cyclase domain-containing protein [Planobispora takensis]|uniref:Guanylate cyclase n=1 Tax=Planobispora takensis TaxID=1367882 RepID=A0A8J3SRZ6_9ACTN|nr:adenylate/guanylate cyclase domain-containing protein [Planobispora takensis]GIH99461.1 guanylate cyclase [Planobispora takensis]